MKKYLKEFFVIEIILYLCSAPLLLFPNRYTFIGVLFLFITAFIRFRITGKWIPETILNIPILVFLLTAIFGTIISPEISLSLNRLSVLILGIATYYLFVDWSDPVTNPALITSFFTIAGLLIAIGSFFITDWTAGTIGLPFYFTEYLHITLYLPGSGVPNPAVGVNPRIIAGTLAMLLPFPISLFLNTSKKTVRWAGLISIPIMMFPLILSQTLQAGLPLLLALVLMLILKGLKPIWITGFVILSAAILAVFAKYFLLSDKIFARIVYGVNARFEIWNRAINISKDMFFTGNGLNAFPAVVDYYGLPSEILFSNAHNTFLQTMTDQGIIGLLAFLFIMLVSLFLGIKAAKTTQNTSAYLTLLGSIGAITAFLGYGFVDSMTLGNKPAVLLWGILGTVIGLAAQTGTAPNWAKLLADKTKKSYLFLLGALMILVSFPIWGSFGSVNIGRIALHKTADLSQNYSQLLNFAIADASFAAKLLPSNPRSYILSGWANAKLGDALTAIEEWEKALTLDPDNKNIHYQIAEEYYKTGNISQAVEHWKAAKAEDILFYRGTSALDQGQTEKAAEWFSFLIQINPNNNQAKQHLAEIYNTLSHQAYDNAKIETAIHYAEKSIELNPAQGWRYVWLGELLREQGKYTQALVLYRQIPQRVNDPEWAWRSLIMQADIYMRLRQFDKAVTLYKQAVKLSQQQNAKIEDQVNNLLALGKILLITKEKNEAKQIFIQVLHLDPTNQTALRNLEKLKEK